MRSPVTAMRRAHSSPMENEALGTTATFDYDLPRHLIASRPADRRDESRLLAIDRARGSRRDHRFTELVDLLRPGDVLVVNDSRVFPARLIGTRPGGAPAEVLLTRPAAESGASDPAAAFEAEAPNVWEAIVRPGAKLKPGRRVAIAPGFDIDILASREDGTRVVRLEGDAAPWTLIERHGHMPLPPYIERPDDERDRERYQTVYADALGSVAAPTAGLHFTPELLSSLEARGVIRLALTLHVGIGTFRPVRTERIDDHRLHAEAYRVTPQTAAALNAAREAGARVVAVGTTSCRVLETICDRQGQFAAGTGWTELFIRPGHVFRGVDALVTNFHLPRSSLFMLVAAFAGPKPTFAAYEHAVRAGYRFYSYGDAMAIT